MDVRVLGGSGLRVPVLSLGTATFGGADDAFFSAWGSSDVAEARHLVDICMAAGCYMFDTADIYSRGRSEEVLGQAIAHYPREEVLISTKATFRMGSGPNDFSSSRYHLIQACEASLRRLQTDYIDIYTMHGFDGVTPPEETLRALDDLMSSGKVRYLACSNFSGWHLMKSLAIADRYGWGRYVAHQAYYSLVGREYEWELMPLALDQRVGTIVWSPLAQGQLTGKIRPGQAAPDGSRLQQIGWEGSPVADDLLAKVLTALEDVAQQVGKTLAQVAINWLLQRPTVANVIIGARNEAQLKQNLGSVGWTLSAEQVAQLDQASQVPPTYPYWHQRHSLELNPMPVPLYPA